MNKLIIIGVGAVVVIAVIVVLVFVQNQADRAEQVKIQQVADIMAAKQNVLDTCSITSQMIGTTQKNLTEYTACVSKYYARAGEPVNETRVKEIQQSMELCKNDNRSKYDECMKADVSNY
jgi:outer membrane lipoprotein-sorting protein